MKLTLFQILSLLPLVIGYLALSWGAWRHRHDDLDWVVMWAAATAFIGIVLPLIAFTTN